MVKRNSYHKIYIVFKLIGSIVYNIAYQDDYKDFEHFERDFWKRAIIKLLFMYGTAYLIIYPIALSKNVSKLRFVAIFAIISMVYITMVLYNF